MSKLLDVVGEIVSTSSEIVRKAVKPVVPEEKIARFQELKRNIDRLTEEKDALYAEIVEMLKANGAEASEKYSTNIGVYKVSWNVTKKIEINQKVIRETDKALYDELIAKYPKDGSYRSLRVQNLS